MHVEEAVNACVPPVATDVEAGPTETEASVGTGVELMVIAAEASLVTPLSVAFTKSVTVPAVLPALKVIGLPVEALSVPRVLVRVQE